MQIPFNHESRECLGRVIAVFPPPSLYPCPSIQACLSLPTFPPRLLFGEHKHKHGGEGEDRF